ncbi:MAG TPA: glycoside hydrolase family 44 protein [Fimbriimonadaceae bacterium]|nr:glycoside hydrolase family 44 protein [Fimbriimonadaceae bacterium]
MTLLPLVLLLTGCRPGADRTSPGPDPAQGPETAISIDAGTTKPISPYIYGANQPEWDKEGDLFTFVRQGGNRMTAYNWETNASNAGNDYHFQNDNYMGASDEPGWTVRTFMEPAQAHGAAVILTVPTAGYVSADKKGDGDVHNTPNHLQTRFLKSYARKNAPFVYPPDLNDHAVYQDEFVAWVEKVKSPATPVWFDLDNEPDLWGSTHEEIWPKNPTYAQIIANNIEFAGAIKDAAPGALVFGPVNYGWGGFMTFQGANDGGGRNFLDVYLAAMKDAEAKAGKRLLDTLDVHWYPEAQGDGVRVTDNSNKPGVAPARIQAPRSLWDPDYVETSWITRTLGGKPIALLPLLFGKLEVFYPGTKLAITEYNYGGGSEVSGAIAQADVLGIYGRYGVFAAANWGVSSKDVAELDGFRAFRNFDGAGARFGDLGLPVTGTSAASNSVYAALDSKDAKRLTLVVINKGTDATSFRFSFRKFTPGTARAFTVTAASLGHAASTPVRVRDEDVLFSAPGLSVSTIEIKAG